MAADFSLDGEKLSPSPLEVVNAHPWIKLVLVTLKSAVSENLRVFSFCFYFDHNLDVGCKVSEWSQWTSCSLPCGGGSQSRWRKIVQQPVGGGAACPVLDDTRRCNSQACGNYKHS